MTEANDILQSSYIGVDTSIDIFNELISSSSLSNSNISSFIVQRIDDIFNGITTVNNVYNSVLTYIAAEAILAVITQNSIQTGIELQIPSRIPANFTTINTTNNITCDADLVLTSGDITASVIKSNHSKIEFSHVAPGHGGLDTPSCIIRGDFDGYPDIGIEFDGDVIQSRYQTATHKLYLNYFGGQIYAGGGGPDDLVTVGSAGVSDDRMKFNEVSFGEALPLISQLQVKQYEKTSHIMTTEEELAFERGEDGFATRVPQGPHEYFGHITEIGVIAQELYNVIPVAVTVGTEVKEWKVKYNQLTCVAIKAIQELNATVASLEARIVALGG